MQTRTTHPTSTQAVLHVTAEAAELKTIKEHVLKELAKQVKVPGFRAGKIPPELVEKNVNQGTLQSEFLEHAINDLYPGAVKQELLRPVDRPQIDIKKYVPFSTLEFEATVPVVGEVKLGDYKKLNVDRAKVTIAAKDVDDVITALRKRSATTVDVDRATKADDQVLIDFVGVDEEGKPVKGAEGSDYPLTLGSDTFIPGFEDNLLGLKAGEEKSFALKFPKDYGVKALASRNVTFTVTVKKVQKLDLPKLDDTFAASVGPVKSVDELKSDVKRELTAERERQADLDYQSDLVRELAAKSKVEIPEILINDQIESMMRELQQNLLYRGQTIQEFLEAQGKTEEEYRKEILAKEAEERLKAGLVIAEVAEKEKIDVMPEELDIRIQSLKGQYQDPQMQAELDKPENRREIASRLLSEKTVAKIADYASKSAR